MSRPHWDYLLALEDDLIRLGRYVDFHVDNRATYSIELARILMAASQETDVLLKQIVSLKGGSANNEAGYRAFIPGVYPLLQTVSVDFGWYNLSCTPFEEWASNKTPEWWTANNKVKHERHNHFSKASLENALNAVSGLLVANIYFYDAEGSLKGLFPGTRLLNPHQLITSVSPMNLGWVPNYKVI